MKSISKILTSENGSTLLMVLVFSAVTVTTLGLMSIYSTNQSNYLNRVREAFELNEATEQLAKLTANQIFLGQSAILQRGDGDAASCPDLDTSDQKIPVFRPIPSTDTAFNAVNGFCELVDTNGDPIPNCVTRPDTGEEICQLFEVSKFKSSGNGTMIASKNFIRRQNKGFLKESMSKLFSKSVSPRELLAKIDRTFGRDNSERIELLKAKIEPLLSLQKSHAVIPDGFVIGNPHCTISDPLNPTRTELECVAKVTGGISGLPAANHSMVRPEAVSVNNIARLDMGGVEYEITGCELGAGGTNANIGAARNARVFCSNTMIRDGITMSDFDATDNWGAVWSTDTTSNRAYIQNVLILQDNQ
ncbi:MAG: hypothetical protein AB8E15_07520 [Bdellovibrionales bacterium]